MAPASGASTQDQGKGWPSHNQAWPRGQGEPGSGQSMDTCPTLCTADDNMGGQDSKVPAREIRSSVSSVAAMRGGGEGVHCPCALLPGCWGDVLSSGTVALSLSPSAGTPTAPSASLSPRVVSVHLQPLASTGFSPRLTEMLIRDQVTTVSVGATVTPSPTYVITNDPAVTCSNSAYFPEALLSPAPRPPHKNATPHRAIGPFSVYTRSLADLPVHTPPTLFPLGSSLEEPSLWDVMSSSDKTSVTWTERLHPPNSHVEALIPTVRVLPAGASDTIRSRV